MSTCKSRLIFAEIQATAYVVPYDALSHFPNFRSTSAHIARHERNDVENQRQQHVRIPYDAIAIKNSLSRRPPDELTKVHAGLLMNGKKKNRHTSTNVLGAPSTELFHKTNCRAGHLNNGQMFAPAN